VTKFDDARAAYAEEPAIDSLAAAYLAVEHMTCHGAPLVHIGSTYAEETEHRFQCDEGGERVAVRVWRP
jgi:hypothetical protein